MTLDAEDIKAIATEVAIQIKPLLTATNNKNIDGYDKALEKFVGGDPNAMQEYLDQGGIIP